MKSELVAFNTPNASIQRGRGLSKTFANELRSTPLNFQSELRTLLHSWQSGEQATRRALSMLPEQSRNLIELQQLFNQLHFKSELVTRGAEALGSFVKRLQQLSGS